jgi:hypothetical protein
MTGLNHTTTGGVIGLAIANPLALPVAFGAHFILDSIPHFGNHPSWEDSRRNFWTFIIFDGLLSLTMLITLWFVSDGSLLVIGAAMLCASPDTMHAIDLIGKRFNPSFDIEKYDPTYNFHKRVQTSETPRGAFVEVAWFGLMAAAIVLLS